MDTPIFTSLKAGKVLAGEASEIHAVVNNNLHFRGQLAVNLLKPRRITDFAHS